MSRPNVLLIMTDEERAIPPYERQAMEGFHAEHLTARRGLAAGGVELTRHYAGATACIPSRTTLFTGQYPSLHGVRSTDGLAKSAVDPAMHWLDPDGVPTLGDWFRAAGYQTHYRGKWHVSHADLEVPGTHESVLTNTRDGSVLEDAVAAYRTADRLEPYGFSGWIGPEPHGSLPANTGMVRDGLFAEQVIDLFADLAAQPADSAPWLAVASFVNPHDIGFSGMGWQVVGFDPVPDWVPAVPEAPSQSDSLDDRPDAQAAFRAVWPTMLYPQPADDDYRRLYHYLLAVVDRAIARILDALEDNGLADDTIVVFTSDHGDLLGAHGGLQQKWHNAYDEAIHVPFTATGPGLASGRRFELPTSHVDVVPTLLGLVGADVDGLVDEVSRHHTEVHPLVGRDLSEVLRGATPPQDEEAPVYFMTEDRISKGLVDTGALSGAHFDPVGPPDCVESVIARVDGSLWKLNRYYDPDGAVATVEWELHDLDHDPEERTNRADDPAAPRAAMEELLRAERRRKRLEPIERVTPSTVRAAAAAAAAGAGS